MYAGPPSPGKEEKDMGMEVFFTRAAGVGGHIKAEPEDFIVEEVSILPPPGNGKYTIARIETRGWETNALLKKMSSRLRIPVSRIGFAGMKDKRAVTRQIISFPCEIKDISDIKLPGVSIDVLYKSRHQVFRGNLKGNRFNILIRDIEGKKETVGEICREIEQAGGFPNFFGVQRFGVIRPITHLVGKYIVQGDMEKAVMTYVANPMKGESEDAYKARKFLEETHDFSAALDMYPEKLAFERQMISYLSKKEGDWKGALKELPRNLSVMFIHAYQSYLFNRMLSMRLKQGIPINGVVEGDIIIDFKNGEVQSRNGMKVNRNNIDKINRQVEKGNCFPSGAIIGYDTEIADGVMGEIERKIMEEEGVEPEKFAISELPSLSSQGMRRILLSPVKRIEWEMDETDLRLSFFLPKGCYATCLLREFMKADVQSY